ncbi:hypothetical protein ACJQNG_000195 [Campylobacter jejuni]|uniref:Uncharacterized protein n=1 Tax=Campylobacter jejuni TaxID=197 RepID=A0A3K7V737_CAMJU|nr:MULTISPECIES: hypothetical protein [Campylobacter]ECL0440534.1 hypothetical protein [Campylobacter coli]ALF91578.1 hypothetical protein CjjRM3197_0527 [Campylobacter jejuni subsp. jejuni]ALF93212.1 hypothetical protein CjjRM3196_0527 [Campylobacter jejuni subsp. jejuni]ANS23623.1 hypothetical protein CjjRM1285_0521 [Campylobacter jejuni subsp. jejuni]AOW96895.1 hypothetical protein CjjRM3420_0521 [Campylobacter jejuni subsp. jejuni str. RM3420]
MKQWLSDFKLALIQEDVNKLENLLDELDMKTFIKNLAKESPSEDFLKENANDVFYQVQALLQEAVILIEQKKKTKAVEIQKFQKALTYFKS